MLSACGCSADYWRGARAVSWERPTRTSLASSRSSGNSIGVVNDGELEKRMLRLVKTIEMQSTPQLMNALWEVLGAEKSDAVKRKLSEIQNLI